MSLDPTLPPTPTPAAPPTVRVPDGPAGLLLGRDLFFNTRITGTAEALGRRVVVAGSGAAVLGHLRAWAPVVVFVDLAAGDLVASPALVQYIEAAPAGTPFVAFGSHVDTASLAAAKAVGCDPVLARSRFTADLPALIGRYFGAG